MTPQEQTLAKIKEAFDEEISAGASYDLTGLPEIRGEALFFQKLNDILSELHFCGEEQRKFLDVIEKNHYIRSFQNDNLNEIRVPGDIDSFGDTKIVQKDFEGVDFDKVVQGL